MASAPLAANEDGMTDEELASILRDQERAAISWRDSSLADEQANAIDYYEAEPFGDEEDGRSQVVVPDVAEVCDYMQVSVLRTVCSGDRVVEFEPGDTDEIPDLPDAPEKPKGDPQDPQDPQMAEQMQAYQQQLGEYQQAVAPYRKWEKDRIQAAEDATEAVNYIFMRKQNGYKILLDFLQSGLIEKIGIIKTACINERKRVKQQITLPPEGMSLLEQEGIKPLAVAEQPDGSMLVTIAQDTTVKRYVDYPIPSEEYLFAARSRDADTSEYQAHRARKTLSDLVEMGFDRDVVEGLSSDDHSADFDQRAVERWKDEQADTAKRSPAMREVWLLEEYVRIDRDGDGIAELLKIFRVNDTILEIEEVEEPPFVTWSPFPRAHRMVGNSLAEKVMDIQRIKSVVLRQALDGTYMTNAPRIAVSVDSVTEDTYDDLLTVRPGAIVRYRGAVAPAALNEPFDIQKSLGMIEHMDGMRETRTGITRLNQGIDEDTLNKTASGQAQLQATGQQMEEFVARNFVDALAQLFSKKLRLMADHGNPIALKVDGSYRRVDPSSWDRGMNVAVRVGLGSGRKEQRLLYRSQLLTIQQQGMAYGLADAKGLYNNAVGMIRDSNLGNPSDFLIDPDSDQFSPPPPQQDPAMAKAQSDMQIAQQRAQFDAQQAQTKQQMDAQAAQAGIEVTQQLGAAKLDGERQHGELKLQLERERYAAEAELAQQKAAQEASLAQQKAEFEAQLAQQQADRQYELQQQQAERDHSLARERAAGDHAVALAKAQSMPRNRPGGDLSK